MATFFGEVREIPSRAVDEDEEIDVEIPTVFFDLPEFSDMTQLPAYDTVICATGLAPTVFLESYLISKELRILGYIKLNPVSTPEAEFLGLKYRKQPHVVGKLCYDEANRALVCVSEKEVPNESAAEIASYFVDLSKSSSLECLIITALHYSYYKTGLTSEIRFPILRQLKTVTEGEVGGIMTLETPNTLSGLGAALLTECEVRGFRACLVAQYYESLDSDTVTKLEPCLGIERLRKLIKKPIEQARQYSQHLLRTSKIDRGNMYF
ncbi:proteasome assembly chaperone 1-like [Varroa jacobsoni]|uniref:Proteasome assembly chaperone 1 n=1 Tax=Varroa destructor TaxID=109461 RepID=A0A7M7MK02_VARDE|nr:proteasome assembly chaperone 1-like [Varroa destructor]XP_022673376.1 proteasome assembly chaperone 1-like [Varroa destructor]XP_022673377.1 proteasome assembly chaperone 1-like [Varroa destructor]XP_022696550.1 proteasome assembly chaperone 1-like [Varroa jacobsoni]XP_022696551.1 proteasome assembly chaperone 1-like [Varroa jacobsoni]XP_022696552.1 proteasome assembly chaperone 1-like [Varroa jacobsoni]